MRMTDKLLAFLNIIFIIHLSYCDDFPKVITPKGTISGTYQTSYGGRKFSAFEGIPFAKPPVGDLRFKDPEMVGFPEGDFHANQTYVCLHYLTLKLLEGVYGTEDCLYLYIYVPKEEITGNENFDVVVYIHGGAFMFGSPGHLARPSYIMDKNVIYVSLNYRLAMLGFMSTQDSVVPGNMGLKDQSTALRWVRENIGYFGGNPNSVTLIGLSAGAACVHYHYLSPMSKGLFDRGFSQSGTALNSWSLRTNTLNYTQFVAKEVNCQRSSSAEMVDCLRKVDGKELVGALQSILFYNNLLPGIPFGIVIEKDSANPFLDEHPYKLLKEKKLSNDVPWITSNVRDEGIIPIGFIFSINKIRDMGKHWHTVMAAILDLDHSVDDNDIDDILDKLWEKYIPSDIITNANTYDLVKLCTDRYFLHHGEKALRLHSKASSSPVYYYMFNYTLQQRFMFPFMKKGIAHSDDGRLMFDTFISVDKLEPDDESMKDVLLDFLVNYAANKSPEINGVAWKPVDPSSEEIDYMQINGPGDVKMEKIKELCDNAFWDGLKIKENENFVD